MQRKPGRPPIGERAMSAAEKQRRYREKRAKHGCPLPPTDCEIEMALSLRPPSPFLCSDAAINRAGIAPAERLFKMNDRAIHREKKPLPPELPGTRAALLEDRVIDSEPELNDLVDEILQSLWDNTDFRRLLYATYDEQAVEGSLSTDNVEAARMIREKAAEIGSNVQKEKLHTIVKSLNVVLRRYNKSRKARRQTVHGETVPDENNNE